MKTTAVNVLENVKRNTARIASRMPFFRRLRIAVLWSRYIWAIRLGRAWSYATNHFKTVVAFIWRGITATGGFVGGLTGFALTHIKRVGLTTARIAIQFSAFVLQNIKVFSRLVVRLAQTVWSGTWSGIKTAAAFSRRTFANGLQIAWSTVVKTGRVIAWLSTRIWRITKVVGGYIWTLMVLAWPYIWRGLRTTGVWVRARTAVVMSIVAALVLAWFISRSILQSSININWATVGMWVAIVAVVATVVLILALNITARGYAGTAMRSGSWLWKPALWIALVGAIGYGGYTWIVYLTDPSLNVGRSWSKVIRVKPGQDVAWERRGNVEYEIKTQTGEVYWFRRDPVPDTRHPCERYARIPGVLSSFQIRVTDRAAEETRFDIVFSPYTPHGPCGETTPLAVPESEEPIPIVPDPLRTEPGTRRVNTNPGRPDHHDRGRPFPY